MNELHDDNTTTFVRKQGIQSIKFKMWVELSSNFCHLSDIIRPPLRTNSLYEKPTVVFSPHTHCGRVRLARFTLEDHAYGASRLPKRPKTTVLQSTEKPVFELPFAYPVILFLSRLVKKSIYRVSVIFKLAMEWYVMRMCAN